MLTWERDSNRMCDGRSMEAPPRNLQDLKDLKKGSSVVQWYSAKAGGYYAMVSFSIIISRLFQITLSSAEFLHFL